MFHVEHSDVEKLNVKSVADIVQVSAKTDDGIGDLFKLLESKVEDAMAPREVPSLTRVRHRRALEATVEHLHRFEDNASVDAVLAAEDVRMAARSLGQITGRVGVEDMLDVVFSDFCIGK